MPDPVFIGVGRLRGYWNTDNNSVTDVESSPGTHSQALVTGGVHWVASLNSLYGPGPSIGDYFQVTVATNGGLTTIDGISSWAVNDFITFITGSVWSKLSHTDTIASVILGDTSTDELAQNLYATRNLGVGTLSPSNNLEIESSSGDQIFEMDNNATNSANFQIQNGAGNNRVDIVTNALDGGNPASLVDTTLTMKNQRVGIMQTNPSYTLDVVGTGQFTSDLSVGGNLTVAGSTTTVNQTVVNVTNAFVFEGASADAYESTFAIIEPTADRTIYLPNQSGYLPVLAVASINQITSTPTELNMLAGIQGIADEDSMSSNSAAKLATQQSIKAYVDSQTHAATLTEEQVEDYVGAMFSSNTETFITATYEDGDGTIDLVVPVLDEDDMSSDSAANLATQQSIKAYVDASVTGEDTLAEMNDTNITSPADASLLLYDTGTSTWRDGAMSGDATISDTGAVTLAATNTNLTTLSNVTSVGTLNALAGGTGDLNWDSGTLFVDSSEDRVGIGTTSPARALHIGDASDTTGNGTIRLQGYSAGGSGNFHEIVSSGDNLEFLRNTTSCLFLKYDGSVGIGTQSPDTTLRVNGRTRIKTTTAGVSSFEVSPASDSVNSYAGIVCASSNFATTASAMLVNSAGQGALKVYSAAGGGPDFKYQAGNAFAVNGTDVNLKSAGSSMHGTDVNSKHFFTGSLLVASGAISVLTSSNAAAAYGIELPNSDQNIGSGRARAWATYSSVRFKENIATIIDPLEKVMQMRGVTFDWKDSGRHDIGFIAEEVGIVVSEVVKYESNGVEAASLDYARLTALLLEAIKEQNIKINTLVADVEVLKSKIQ
jgi:hypothetical protein